MWACYHDELKLFIKLSLKFKISIYLNLFLNEIFKDAKTAYAANEQAKFFSSQLDKIAKNKPLSKYRAIGREPPVIVVSLGLLFLWLVLC